MGSTSREAARLILLFIDDAGTFLDGVSNWRRSGFQPGEDQGASSARGGRTTGSCSGTIWS